MTGHAGFTLRATDLGCVFPFVFCVFKPLGYVKTHCIVPRGYSLQTLDGYLLTGLSSYSLAGVAALRQPRSPAVILKCAL